MKCPKIAELTAEPIVGAIIADLVAAFDITDSELPDIIPDEIEHKRKNV